MISELYMIKKFEYRMNCDLYTESEYRIDTFFLELPDTSVRPPFWFRPDTETETENWP